VGTVASVTMPERNASFAWVSTSAQLVIAAPRWHALAGVSGCGR
jgi:hypothetical protein